MPELDDLRYAARMAAIRILENNQDPQVRKLLSILRDASEDGSNLPLEQRIARNIATHLKSGPALNPNLEAVLDYVSIGNVGATEHAASAFRSTDPLSPLTRATIEGNTEEVKRLIRAGVDLNAVDKDGNTALHWAGAKGRNEIAELLVGAGADHTLLNKAEATASMLATGGGHVATEAEFAATAMSRLGKVAGSLGKGLKVVAPIIAGTAIVGAAHRVQAAVTKGEITPDNANEYNKTQAIATVIDTLSPIPINLNANATRDFAVRNGISSDLSATLINGNPDSQIGRVREALPPRAEGITAPQIEDFIRQNANIKNLEGQEAADPNLREIVKAQERELYAKFSVIISDPKLRKEMERISGIPIDKNEITFNAPPAAVEGGQPAHGLFADNGKTNNVIAK